MASTAQARSTSPPVPMLGHEYAPHLLAAAAVAAVLLLPWLLGRKKTAPAAVPESALDYTAVPVDQLRPWKPIYHITMGALRNSSPQELITIDSDYLERVTLRKQLVQAHGRGVHGVVPNSPGAAAVRELYEYLLNEHLPSRYPAMFAVVGGEFVNKTTGERLPLSAGESDDEAEAALRRLAGTVEEDLFFLTQRDDGHQCVAFACCFPSGFDPASKLGLGLEAIHGPVPHYERIGPSMERFFAKLEYGKPVRRVNWSVQTHENLYACAGNHMAADEVVVEKDFDIEKTHLRCELQTLTRLPKTHALLFSFKTYMYPVAQIKAEGLGLEFAEATEGLGRGNAPGMWQYKSAVRWGPKVCEYMRA